MGRYNEILHHLDADPSRYEPILPEDEEGRQWAVEWAAGFTAAMQLREQQWEPLLRDQEGFDLFMPILVCLVADDADKLAEIDLSPDDELVAQAPLYLPSAVHEIQKFWRNRASGPSQPIRKGRRTGSNENCPCGSGKKFKRCCGAN